LSPGATVTAKRSEVDVPDSPWVVPWWRKRQQRSAIGTCTGCLITIPEGLIGRATTWVTG
jgi:hypothetical protein